MMLRYLCTILLLCLCLHASAQGDAPYIQVLDIAQDGGYPHMGCNKQCCTRAWDDASLRRNVVCLALVDPASKKWFLFEATPDIKEELHYFQSLTKGKYNYLPEGIFITHAHIGHYTGLMELGREVMNTKNVPVYVLPKLKAFLENNGPWSQLVKLQNIGIQQLTADSAVQLTNGISVTALTVPHRDEYSETAGFRIATPRRKYLFIPDINKWELWDRDIIAQVKSVDIALVDATCYDSTELPGRNKAILHPFVTETMDKFSGESSDMKSKIYFIHFNHTNPLLWDADKRKRVRRLGFNIAEQGEVL
jgi:pyrroloquinoline quinone biosynthesis protein B